MTTLLQYRDLKINITANELGLDNIDMVCCLATGTTNSKTVFLDSVDILINNNGHLMRYSILANILFNTQLQGLRKEIEQVIENAYFEYKGFEIGNHHKAY